MARWLLCVLAVLFCAQLAIGGRWWHHQRPEDSCSFSSDKGRYDLRLLVRDMQGRDWILQDEKTHAAYFFNPCGGVHSANCPEGAAFCEVTEKDATGISFGSGSDMRWAAVEDGVEITYGNGEQCGSGVPRKTVVQLTCSHPNADDASSHRTLIKEMIIDDCVVTIKAQSPYGCAVEQFCTAFAVDDCENSEGLCEWNKSQEACQASDSGCFRWGAHRISAPALFGILLSIMVLFSCGVGLCICACCRSQRKRRNMRLPVVAPKRRKSRSSKKAKKSSKKKASASAAAPAQQEFVYQPMQQYVPMAQFYAPLNPYGAPEAFPLVQIAAPEEQK